MPPPETAAPSDDATDPGAVTSAPPTVLTQPMFAADTTVVPVAGGPRRHGAHRPAVASHVAKDRVRKIVAAFAPPTGVAPAVAPSETGRQYRRSRPQRQFQRRGATATHASAAATALAAVGRALRRVRRRRPRFWPTRRLADKSSRLARLPRARLRPMALGEGRAAPRAHCARGAPSVPAEDGSSLSPAPAGGPAPTTLETRRKMSTNDSLRPSSGL